VKLDKTSKKIIGLRLKSFIIFVVTPESKNQIFFFLTLFAGVFILYPFLDYQSIMATGDHGRDLYAARAALEGRVPYRDYWWVYGPLMPYYYALFFKSLGVHVPALLTGKALLSLVSALLIYGTLLTATVTPLLALIGALWFLVFPPDFFITYNHTGGTTLLLALTFLVFQYLARPRVIFLYLGLGAVFFLSLVKLNFGVTGLFCLLVAVFGIDRTCKNPVTPGKKIFYWAALVLPFFVFLVYGWFLRGLPVYALRQCLPYFGGDQPYNISIPAGIGMLVKLTFENITATWQNILFTLVVVGATVRSARQLTSKGIDPKERTRLLATIGILVLFYVTSVHEFVLSGVFYRSFWAKPFACLLMFLFLSIGTRELHKGVRGFLCAALLAVVGLNILNTQSALRMVKTPAQYLEVKRGKVFLGNQTPWINTVTQTVSFLEANLREDELFFALPYDPLYYFLTDKTSPTRQLIFFDHIKIPPQQEKEILAELEENRVNWVLLSNRQHATEEYGLGILGKTYCPLIGEYIERNFTTVAQFGDRVNEPGWAWNHGVRVLKRNQNGGAL